MPQLLSGPPPSAGSYLVNRGASRPRDAGEFGVALRWRPEWLDGTLGLYYRRLSDKLAAVLLTPNPGSIGPLSPLFPSPFEYRQYYAEDVDLVGVSLAKQVLGASLGAEASWRHDAPLLAQSLGFAAAPAPALEPVNTLLKSFNRKAYLLCPQAGPKPPPSPLKGKKPPSGGWGQN